MKIMVINPPNNRSRREFQLRQADRLGLELEFVNGVSVGDLPSRVLQNAANDWTRLIRAQDVACTFSHWSVWEKVANLDQKVCILEDDVLISNSFKPVLSYIRSRPDEWNCVYDLEYAQKKHTLGKTPIWQNAELSVEAHRIYKNKRGAAAYVLGPAAAQRLLDEAKHYHMMEGFLWTRKWMTQMQIEPCPVVQLDVLDPTATFGENNVNPANTMVFKNSSWVKAKLKRLSISIGETPQVLSGATIGERRPLRMNPSEFCPPGVLNPET
ncbi:glycosyltransferase family 25 protein [Ruegeria sp. Ofav3-42]|uniref:glycosyltransferase family 25 protein n=1 Tax=Ruegeria sp. Ofav3-42 TaxID=2917759 RepID=UPI001EF443CC|nr:glycosyltransferase family 25 protein [Ruegeria sp. Ofav3-42]MCG7522001.1 glycosyltransferase family 25 protein [Ruegeria sp. Ofav3-42]